MYLSIYVWSQSKSTNKSLRTRKLTRDHDIPIQRWDHIVAETFTFVKDALLVPYVSRWRLLSIQIMSRASSNMSLEPSAIFYLTYNMARKAQFWERRYQELAGLIPEQQYFTCLGDFPDLSVPFLRTFLFIFLGKNLSCKKSYFYFLSHAPFTVPRHAVSPYTFWTPASWSTAPQRCPHYMPNCWLSNEMLWANKR